ncbi:uncharacterized protein LOC133523079 [Cydia pomonella]|uniref:uncharacterized protein LOC133523079 n=1 Tax=Cydia pomonella TaxID=82600 RepID=UPI002ADDFCA7|nr:uncharacterized protein LOC133523079 [Cydia pomonella]
MRDPSLDETASADNAMQESSVVEAIGGETPALPGLDYEIEAILQVPEVEESPFGQYVKDCPVCKSAVRCYFMNFNEKVVMCENTTCSWPFGYEEPQCLKHDEALSADDEVESLKVMTYGPIPPTGSIISTTAWSEMDKSNKGLDSEEPGSTLMHQSDAARHAKLQEVLKQKEAELQTKKNLQDIKKLNVQLQKTYEDEDEISCIRNEKWIKHLNTLQNMSGIQLLREEEMALLQEKEPQGLTMNIDAENTAIIINLAPSMSTELNSTKESTALKDSTVIEESTALKEPSAIIEATVAKEPTACKESNTVKEQTVAESIALKSTATELSRPKETSAIVEPVRTEDKVIP